jgi:hypothetical protein
MGGDADSLYTTTDAGLTWTALPVALDYVLGMHFFSASEGLINSGNAAELLHIMDGGHSYTAISCGSSPLDIGAVVFPGNGDIGYAATTDSIYKSIDHGVSWSTITTNVIQPTDMYFLNADTGIVVGNFGTAAYTTDGATFTTVDFPDLNSLRGCWITPSGTAYVSGTGGSIYRKGLGEVSTSVVPITADLAICKVVPLNGSVEITVSADLVGSTFLIYNATGQVMDEGRLNSTRVQVGAQLGTGLYFAALKSANGDRVYRFAVQ